ncbi:MAG: glycosyltransferase family 2 protein [Crocinitomicaceae bacterium]|nr:glycosyltransferase family 2 protein [Crocinitomicaceae bacterium]
MDVAVVILNYNGRNYLEQFLPSVVANSGNARVIVADNCSTDDSVDFLKTNYPDLELIINSENGGFAKGYNEALKKVDAEYYVLLNSDIEVTPNWIDPCIAILESDPTIAACHPKVKAYHKQTHFEHAGATGGFLDQDYFPFCRGRIFEFAEEDEGQYDETREVFWATGACMFIRSKVFHELGGLDEAFFAHMEEIDLCWRIKKRGMKIFYVHGSEVFHVGGGTLSYDSPRKTYLNFRNSIFMIIKNHEGLLFFKLFKRLAIDGIAAWKFLLTGQAGSYIAVFKAHMAMYSNLARLLKQRKEIKKTSGVYNKTGTYSRSIVLDKFLRGRKKFSELDSSYFN